MSLTAVLSASSPSPSAPRRTRTLPALLALTIAALACTLLLAACDADSAPIDPVRAEPAAAVLDAEVVRPPFPVRGELDGLLLVWFDAEGPHTAQKRDDIPAEHRLHVRVDSLTIAPDARLDPAFVYLADVRSAGSDGSYAVRKVARESFEALLSEARTAAMAAAEPTVEPGGAGGGSVDPNADVVIYGASWCGACRQAEAYLRSRNVAFVEKDIERDPGAQQEMVRKAQAQGLNPTGIPVIDFRGRILLGFDRGSIDRLIASGGGATPAGGGRPI